MLRNDLNTTFKQLYLSIPHVHATSYRLSIVTFALRRTV